MYDANDREPGLRLFIEQVRNGTVLFYPEIYFPKGILLTIKIMTEETINVQKTVIGMPKTGFIKFQPNPKSYNLNKMST